MLKRACIYNYSKNGLTLQKCLDRANKVNLKLQVYNFDDDQDYKKTPKFILGFGGIDDDALKPHVDALIKSLIIKYTLTKVSVTYAILVYCIIINFFNSIKV